jgi:hypothetical protein
MSSARTTSVVCRIAAVMVATAVVASAVMVATAVVASAVMVATAVAASAVMVATAVVASAVMVATAVVAIAVMVATAVVATAVTVAAAVMVASAVTVAVAGVVTIPPPMAARMEVEVEVEVEVDTAPMAIEPLGQMLSIVLNTPSDHRSDLKKRTWRASLVTVPIEQMQPDNRNRLEPLLQTVFPRRLRTARSKPWSCVT